LKGEEMDDNVEDRRELLMPIEDVNRDELASLDVDKSLGTGESSIGDALSPVSASFSKTSPGMTKADDRARFRFKISSESSAVKLSTSSEVSRETWVMQC
jgi:hypothetical protein